MNIVAHSTKFVHVHVLNGLLHKLELKVKINKFKKHPKLSFIHIGGLFRYFGNGSMDSFLKCVLVI